MKTSKLKGVAFLLLLVLIGSNSCVIKSKEPATISIEAGDIIGMPIKNAQGYLVLDKRKHPRIMQWEIEVYKNGKEQVETAKLDPGINYWRIPKQYQSAKEKYTFKVRGLAEAGGPTIQTNPFPVSADPSLLCVGCTGYELACSWECVGLNYAYKINAYKNPNGGDYYLSLEETYEYYDEDLQVTYPYYYYAPESAFAGGDPNGYSPIGLINTATEPGQYCSATGSTLNGNVWGIAKELGPWKGSYILTDFIIGDPPCADGIDAPIMIFNMPGSGADFSNPGSSPDPRPFLSCSPTSCNYGSGGIGNNPRPCDEMESLSFGTDFFDNIAQALGCFYSTYDPVAQEWNYDWGSRLSRLTVRNINDITAPPIYLDAEKAFRKNGEWLVEKPSLDKGLYSIGLFSKGGKYNYLILEIQGEPSKN